MAHDDSAVLPNSVNQVSDDILDVIRRDLRSQLRAAKAFGSAEIEAILDATIDSLRQFGEIQESFVYKRLHASTFSQAEAHDIATALAG
ncbi:hypothetical protein [Oceanicaulis sp.]|uniref:hypothetical protein n=1 Tax=Oceanicaulis sp. TaxID=1924941 RepID=UPI003D2B260B